MVSKDAPLADILGIARTACEAFSESRRINPENEHAYVSEVQLLLRVLDHVARPDKRSVPTVLADTKTDPFLREAMDRAETLLDQVRSEREGERPSHYVEECRAALDRLYGKYNEALQTWNSLLTRKDVYKPPIRRQIVWTILRRNNGEWGHLKQKEVINCLDLLNQNYVERPDDNKSLELWLRAVRHTDYPPSLEAISERIGYWKSNTNALDASYYQYVLHMLRAFEGSTLARDYAERAIKECQELARFRRNRRLSFEWLGRGKGIARLVHYSQLGQRQEDGFWEKRSILDRVEGRIAAIQAPQKGSIELSNGQSVFFHPAFGGFQSNRDENSRVTAYIGFTYDGPRAWEVTAK